MNVSKATYDEGIVATTDISKMNDLLVHIFQSILRVEEQQLRNSDFDLSISELHLLEAVGKTHEAGCTCSALAEALAVTMPTVTVAIKRLEAKGYVTKTRSETDGRMVRIVLTKKGHRADVAHRYFHRQMVHSLIRDADEQERSLILRSLENLDAFLAGQLSIEEEKMGHE